MNSKKKRKKSIKILRILYLYAILKNFICKIKSKTMFKSKLLCWQPKKFSRYKFWALFHILDIKKDHALLFWNRHEIFDQTIVLDVHFVNDHWKPFMVN